MSLHVLIFLEIVVRLQLSEGTKPKHRNRNRESGKTHAEHYSQLGSSAFLLDSRLFLFLSEMLNLLTAVVFLFNLFYLRHLLSTRLLHPSLLRFWNSILAFCLEPVLYCLSLRILMSNN